jgi:hypothetical protein
MSRMPSLDLTTGDLVMLALTIVLVVLPSRLSSIGNLLGRLIKGKPQPR